jgi:hypothetical protein
MTKKDDEFAALKREVEELKAKLFPPKPFKPQPHQQYDPTAGMRMPPSALAAMVAVVPSNFMRDVVRDNRAPTGPTGAIPTSQQSSGGGGPVNVAGGGKVWVDPAPLRPPPGINWVDAQLIADDVKQRGKSKP